MALTILCMAMLVHLAGAGADFVAAVRYPLELDYGEGIVWQQFLRIPGPTMYRTIEASPYVVFHYPPVFYLLTHVMNRVLVDPLAAGRAVSALAALSIMPSVFGITTMATRRPGVARGWAEIALMLACAALVVCLHPIRGWAILMRVDTVGIALAMAGLALGIRADGRFRGTVLALLFCVAAVFAKQTLAAAGAAVFLGALWHRPRQGLAAGLVAAAVGMAALLMMQALTDGGFLANIVGNNINRFALRNPARVLRDEGSSLAPMIVMVAAGTWLLHQVLPSMAWGRVAGGFNDLRRLRTADPASRARATLLLHFGLCTLTLVTLFKSGGTYNYLNEWMCSGCALIGVVLVSLWRQPAMQRGLQSLLAGMAVSVALLPLHVLPGTVDPAINAEQRVLIDRIAAADQPVLSDFMSLMMRAGKPVYAEPSIVTELAVTGRWDDAPLVRMIRDKGFAFILTWDNKAGETERRSAAVNAAIHEAYPQVTMIRRGMWLWEAE